MKSQERHQRMHRKTVGFFCMMLGGLLSTVVAAQPDADQHDAPQSLTDAAVNSRNGLTEVVIFDGDNVAPWHMYLGSSTNWMIPVEGPETQSYKNNIVSVRTTPYMKKFDAYQAEWKGGLGQVYWQGSESSDLTALAANGGALSMIVRVDKSPKKTVDLKMDCGYPCAGSLDMTKLFKTVPKDQWFRISVKLECFREAGANLGHVVAPLVIATKGSFEMSFAEVRILTDPPPESVIPCG